MGQEGCGTSGKRWEPIGPAAERLTPAAVFAPPMPTKRAGRKDDDERYPNMAAERAADREEHIKRAMEAGMSRQQAERHADEEMAERDED